jgi:glucose/arabinose dehydrogenase
MKKSTTALFLLIISATMCPALYRAQANFYPATFAPQEITPAEVRIELEPIVTAGLDSPVLVTSARDGSNRLFIVEQTGRIKVLQPDSNTPTVFLNVASKIVFGGERGLLGLAFHPDFINNHRFFINYTRQGDGATIVAEYQALLSNPNLADTNEVVLLTIPQPGPNHNGGMLEFGPDKFLYISMGDGGFNNDPNNRAQNLEDLLGKILRIDVDHPNGQVLYSSPPDNPFFGAIAGRDEIFAYGLRNPWRFSFDRLTGEIYAGDVGQNVMEEIDIITRGGNYGWKVLEGTRCTGNGSVPCTTPGFIAPIVEYSHAQGGRCSVTGGYVYRGAKSSLPVGSYVYADFCTGEIFLLTGTTQQVLLDTNVNISSFGEDEAGEIYVVGLGGSIHRIKNPVVTPPPPGTFNISNPVIRRRSSGEVIQPVTVRANGKKFQLVVSESSAAPVPESMGASLFVNGVEMNTEYTTEAGAPVFVARLRRFTLEQAGTLVIEVVRTNGTRSNQLSIQVAASQ